ncbi:hypothetical protein KQH82_04990 [bacterium]|nr:hypothetical protein [bacterium]
MDYGYIVNRAFQIAWRYKSLWVFGLFVGGFTNLNLNLPGDSFDFGQGGSEPFGAISPEVFGALLMLGLILGLVFLIAYCIAAPALIDGVNRIERGGVYTFGASFSTGVDNFWRILGLGVLLFVVMVAIFVFGAIVFGIGAAIIGISAGDSNPGPAIAAIILGVLILIPVFIFLYFLIATPFQLAQRVIVVRSARIADALSEGWLLFKQNFGKALVIFLIRIGISLAIGIVMFIIFAVIALLVLIFVPNPMEHLAEAVILGILFGLPISLVLGGFMGTFDSSLYTLFYFELVEPAASRQPNVQPPPITPETTG